LAGSRRVSDGIGKSGRAEIHGSDVQGDFAVARKFVHDDLSFRGPIDAFDNC
jgi:hypothetical protein